MRCLQNSKRMFFVTLAGALVLSLAPDYAQADAGTDLAQQFIVQRRAATATRQHGRIDQNRRNPQDPNQYLPDANVDAALQDSLQRVSRSKGPLSGMTGALNGLTSNLSSSMAKTMGPFTSGLSAIPGLTAASHEQGGSVACAVGGVAEPVSGGVHGAVLATPIVGLRAMPIAGGGASGCSPGAHPPCKPQHFQDQADDAKNPLPVSPLEPESAPKMQQDE